jgi:antitoxin component of MazEF toxin-antitoxin module
MKTHLRKLGNSKAVLLPSGLSDAENATEAAPLEALTIDTEEWEW